MTNVSILSTLHLHKKYVSCELRLYCRSHQIALKLVSGPSEPNSLLAFTNSTFLFCSHFHTVALHFGCTTYMRFMLYIVNKESDGQPVT